MIVVSRYDEVSWITDEAGEAKVANAIEIKRAVVEGGYSVPTIRAVKVVCITKEVLIGSPALTQ
jgi:hypothetical protein